MRVNELIPVAPGILDAIDEVSAAFEADASSFDSSVCWKCADDRLVPVCEMDDDHLQRTISMLTFTRRVESRGVYRLNGDLLAVWDRLRWAAFLEAEMSRRDGRSE